MAVLPIVAAGALLSAGTATASVAAEAPADGVSVMANCTGTPSYGGATWTVRCGTEQPNNEFRAFAICPNGDVHFGPWVLQGPGHVSVVHCGNPVPWTQVSWQTQ
jgi:hypothetical protein